MKKLKFLSIAILLILASLSVGCTGTEDDTASIHFFTTEGIFPADTYRVYVNEQNIGIWENFCSDVALCIECSYHNDFPNVDLPIGEHTIEIKSKNSNYFTVVGHTTITIDEDDLGDCRGVYLY